MLVAMSRPVIDVDRDLHSALKARAVVERMSLRAWVDRALRASLAHQAEATFTHQEFVAPDGRGRAWKRTASRAVPKIFSTR